MLQSIRDRAQGWIAWFIVAIISVPFALWGIQEYLGVGAEPVVAQVNGSEITERDFENRYRDYREQLRQRFGDAFRPEMFDEGVLRKEALEGMVREELVRQFTERMGMAAGDLQVRSAIAAIGAFQIDGRFNLNAYERALSSRGMSPASFEDRMQQALTTEQLQSAISDSNWATLKEFRDAQRLRQQKRSFAYIRLDADALLETIEVDDARAKSEYEANSADYIAPEQVRLRYIELDRDSIAATLEAAESDLLGYYQQHVKNYMAPEQRKASHILIALASDAPEAEVAEAEKKARAILDRISAGEDFATLAQELSDDPGSAPNGGDLGFFGRGVMVGPFEDAAFSLAQGEISDPVRSDFGFHIIRLDAIQPSVGRSFEEVREEVRSAYLTEQAERKLYEIAERLANLAYEESGSLAPASEALGIDIQVSDWIPKTGGSGIFANPKLLNAAYGDDVLHQGLNSELIEISPQQMLVLRVEDHKESAVRPFDEVRDEIIEKLKSQLASEQVGAQGRKLLESLRSGQLDMAVAAEQAGVEVQQQELVARTGPAPSEISSRAFRMPRPVDDAPVYGEAELADGDFVVLRLDAVQDGDPDAQDDAQRVSASQSMARALGSAEYDHLLKNLRQEGEVTLSLTVSTGID